MNISMFNYTIWSGAHLPLNIQERWKWILTYYDIEHTLWRYPSTYFIGYDKQAGVMGHYMPPHNPSLVPLTLDDLYKLERKHLNQDGCMYASNNRMLSMLWKVGGEGNAVNGAQAPLLCDVTLEMQCLQVLHHALNASNRYRMDEYPNKAKLVDPDWEITTAELVHEMAEDYMRRGMNIPQSIITKLLSFQMSLGDAAHKNYAIIDDWVSEALHQLHLPAIVAGGFATCLGHVTHHNDIDIFAYVPPCFDPFTLQ